MPKLAGQLGANLQHAMEAKKIALSSIVTLPRLVGLVDLVELSSCLVPPRWLGQLAVVVG